MDIKKLIREWMLPIAMTTGASIYLIYNAVPCLHRYGSFLSGIVSGLQPICIFTMLFLTFCRIEPKDLKPHRWHWWLLLIQGGLFSALGLLAYWLLDAFPVAGREWVVLMEGAMLCLICPTATAAAVVTRKLGGDVPGITTYIILINLLTAVLVPLIVPLVHPVAEIDFWTAFSMIMAKVFPLLIMPCMAAWLVRYLFPKVHRWLMRFPDLAFYIWAFALTLAIALTTRFIVHSEMSVMMLLLMALISLVCCVFQFAMGRFVGRTYRPRHARLDRASMQASREITAGQSLGQKNTIFAIWMAYTFMTPETSIVGGLYSIWHNIYNSWQLYRASKDTKDC
ncbi:MAG: transporter [Bacteroidales bacterium]|nr:transporter [Bacteroidales bacterium]